MKKSIFLVLCILTVLLIAACSNSADTNTAQPSDNSHSNSADTNSVQTSGTVPSYPGDPYKLSTLPGTLYIGEAYYVYSADSGYTEEMCAAQGIEKSRVDMYLPLSGYDMIILPDDAQFATPYFQLSVRVKADKDYGISNMNELSDAGISHMATTLVYGFQSTGTVSESTIYENANATYIVFDWQPQGLPLQRRYATIINGAMVYFIAETREGTFTQERDAQIREILDTLTY